MAAGVRGLLALIQRTRVADAALALAARTPLRRRAASTVIDPTSGPTVGSGEMERDWDERARRNARFFVAGYDWETEEQFVRSGYRDLQEIVLRGLEIPADACVLEIGCGLGRLLRPMSERVREAHGIDISSEMVRRAAELLRDRPNVYLRHSTNGLAGFEAASFDFCYSYAVFQHISEKDAVVRYLRDAARVLKPGGLFRFQACRATTSNSAGRTAGTWLGVRFTEAELRKLLETCGFAVLDIVDEASPADKRRWDSIIVTCRKAPS